MDHPLPIIRVDFHNADENGDVQLNTAGTFRDLAREGVVLRAGMLLRLVDRELAATERVRWGKEGLWVTEVDWNEVLASAQSNE